jgi:signal transduction histidine kinase
MDSSGPEISRDRLDGAGSGADSGLMNRVWIPPTRWVLLVATLLGLFSTAQAYRLTSLSPRARIDGIELGSLLFLNLALWYVPAALTGPIFRVAARFRLDSDRWLRAITAHSVAALAFSVLHSAIMIGLRAALWPELRKLPASEWATFAQSHYLRNLDWTLMTYAAVVGLSYAIGYYRESQARALTAARLETRLVEARLKTLEAELHPHFLFNTLHAISTLVHTDPEAADRMISRLSDLLRLTFDRSGAPGVSLKEELEFLQKYLEIEQIRFQDRLTVKFDIDPDALDAEVPRMILQPLVENAIKHGIGPKAGRGLVQVSARRRPGEIWIEVRDNGVGLSLSARARLTNGVGLSNTRARLQYLYGDGHRIDFAEGDGGLAVRLLIPMQRGASATADAVPRMALA